jgi:hypothetical protein
MAVRALAAWSFSVDVSLMDVDGVHLYSNVGRKSVASDCGADCGRASSTPDETAITRLAPRFDVYDSLSFALVTEPGR